MDDAPTTRATFGVAETHSVSHKWLPSESEIRAGWDSLHDDAEASVGKPRIKVLDPLENLTADIVGSLGACDSQRKELVSTALAQLSSHRQSVLRLHHGFEDGERWWWHQIG